MPTEPVTITTTHPSPHFDPEDHRISAAARLGGIDPADLHCIGTGPDGVEEVSAELWSEDGTLLKPRVLSYTRATTWEQRPGIQRDPEPEREMVPALVHDVPTLPRGARWHGIIGEIEDNYISTGEKLVLLDSPAGKAVLEALEREHEAHQLATGG